MHAWHRHEAILYAGLLALRILEQYLRARSHEALIATCQKHRPQSNRYPVSYTRLLKCGVDPDKKLTELQGSSLLATGTFRRGSVVSSLFEPVLHRSRFRCRSRTCPGARPRRAIAHKMLNAVYSPPGNGRACRDHEATCEELMVKSSAPRWIEMLKKYNLASASGGKSKRGAALFAGLC